MAAGDVTQTPLVTETFTVEVEGFAVEVESFTAEVEDFAVGVESFTVEVEIVDGDAHLRAPDGGAQTSLAGAAERQWRDSAGPVPVRPARRGAVRLVLVGAFALDMLLYTMVVPFLPARAQALGATPAVTGMLFASFAIGLFAATSIAGLLTDYLGARRTLLVGLCALLAATLLFAFGSSLPWLFAARAAQGASGAVTWTAGLALVAQLFEPRERPQVFATIFMATGLGTLVGPPLGGVLYTLGGFRAPFLVAAGLVLLDGLGRALFLPGRDRLRDVPASGAMVRALLRNTPFVLALVATFAGAGVFAALDPTVPPLLADRFGFTPLLIGALFGGLTMVYSLSQPVITAAMRRVRPQGLMATGLLICAPLLAVVGWSGTLALTFGALAAITAAAAFTLSPALVSLAMSAETATGSDDGISYGTVYAMYNLAYAGGIFMGPILSGAAITWLGPARGLALVGTVPLTLALPLAIAAVLRRIARGPMRPAASPSRS